MRQGILALLLFAAAGCATTPELGGAGDLSRAVLSGRQNLESFDFAVAGYWKLSAPEREQWRLEFSQAFFGSDLSTNTCDMDERRRFAGVMWLSVLTQSRDQQAWEQDYHALRAALAAMDAEISAAGSQGEAGSGDKRVAELKRRIARDQAIRDLELDRKWSQDLPETARQHWAALKIGRMTDIDCANTEWLRSQLATIGWFDVPTYGQEADKNAWLMVQHADRNPEFQRSVLQKLESLPPGATDVKNLAYLWDRIATAEGRLQRYGTQGRCFSDGSWKPLDVEEPLKLDERRASVGLAPIADHAIVVTARACPQLPR